MLEGEAIAYQDDTTDFLYLFPLLTYSRDTYLLTSIAKKKFLSLRLRAESEDG